MKYVKLFKEFSLLEFFTDFESRNPYKLEEAVPGRKKALGFMGDPVKNIDELKALELYWFPVPSGKGYDVPTLGCLFLRGKGDDRVFGTIEDPDGYDEVVHDLAKLSGDSTGEGDEEVYIGLDTGEDGMIDLETMKGIVNSGRILKFVMSPEFKGHVTGKNYGI